MIMTFLLHCFITVAYFLSLQTFLDVIKKRQDYITSVADYVPQYLFLIEVSLLIHSFCKYYNMAINIQT